jgi:hypothetical protein
MYVFAFRVFHPRHHAAEGAAEAVRRLSPCHAALTAHNHDNTGSECFGSR